MKYLCTIYINEDTLNAMTTDEYNAVVRECYSYEQTLSGKGTLIAAEALEPIQTATTVRKRSDKPSITDGPFAETKEQLAGFFLIDVAEKKTPSKSPPACRRRASAALKSAP
jgi:hypothetical protein